MRIFWTWVGRGFALGFTLLFVSLIGLIGINQIFSHSFVAGRPPAGLGLENNRLLACPNPPIPRWREKLNCVSSLDDDTPYYIEPINFKPHSDEQVLQKIANAIGEHPQIRVRVVNEKYLHFEWSSQLFGFVDDVELWWRPEFDRIDVRSAARLGRQDFGVNRHHIEWLRAVLKEHKDDILRDTQIE